MSMVISQSFVERNEIICKRESMTNLQEAAKAILKKFKVIENLKTNQELVEYRNTLNKKYIPRIKNNCEAASPQRLFAASSSEESAFISSDRPEDSVAIRKKLKPDNLAVWNSASVDVKQSMLKIKVYDEYLQLFNDELAKSGDKELSDGTFNNIRELVGYHLDTNNFWINWKKQENIVTERLTALAEGKLIGTKKSWFGLFSDYHFMNISEGTKCFFNDIKEIFKCNNFAIETIVDKYRIFLVQKTPEEQKTILHKQLYAVIHTQQPPAQDISAIVNEYSEIIESIESRIKECLQRVSQITISYYPNDIEDIYQDFIRMCEHKIPSVKRINLYYSNKLEVFINRRLQLICRFKSIGNSNIKNKIQIDLKDTDKFSKFFQYIYKLSFKVQLFEALASVAVNSSISNQLSNKYSSLINSPTLFDQNTEYYDWIWTEILDELLPKPEETLYAENKRILLTKNTYLLNFIIDFLERKLASSAYSKVEEFAKFIQQLKSPEKITLKQIDIEILTRLFRNGYLASDEQAANAVNASSLKDFQTMINNYLVQEERESNFRRRIIEEGSQPKRV